MRDDSELLRAWGDGDDGAGRELFERHFPSVLRFFRNKADDAVEDLVQSTFANVLGARESFRGDASFRTYLFTVARHELYAYWRRRRQTASDVDIGSTSVEDLGGVSPGTLIAERRDRVILARALRSIPLELQMILELHYWEELTGPELAGVLELPEGTIRSRLRRARELLGQAFEALAHGETVRPTATSRPEDLDGWVAELKDAMGR